MGPQLARLRLFQGSEWPGPGGQGQSEAQPPLEKVKKVIKVKKVKKVKKKIEAFHCKLQCFLTF